MEASPHIFLPLQVDNAVLNLFYHQEGAGNLAVPIFSGLTSLGHSYREDGNVDRIISPSETLLMSNFSAAPSACLYYILIV